MHEPGKTPGFFYDRLLIMKQSGKADTGFLPRCPGGGSGEKLFHGGRFTHNGAEFSQRPDLTTGSSLDKKIAQRRRLDRAGHNLAMAGICRELIEKIVFRSATHDVDRFDAFAPDLFQSGEDDLVFERETLQSAPNQGSRSFRNALAGFVAEVLDRARHAGWIKEAGVIGINK
jgi:hypothetical protein